MLALCMMPLLYALALAAEFRDRPEWTRYFTEAGTQGTFVLYDLQHDRYQVSERHRADTRFIPASTFKIPNSLIALDTGVVTDEHHVFSWDKTMREEESWNRDHTLRTALKYSVVPVYQGVARQIGVQRMQEYVTKFQYGNTDISGGIDQFWLDGGVADFAGRASAVYRQTVWQCSAGAGAEPADRQGNPAHRSHRSLHSPRENRLWRAVYAWHWVVGRVGGTRGQHLFLRAEYGHHEQRAVGCADRHCQSDTTSRGHPPP